MCVCALQKWSNNFLVGRMKKGETFAQMPFWAYTHPGEVVYLHQSSRYIFSPFTDRYFNLIHFLCTFRSKTNGTFDPCTWNNLIQQFECFHRLIFN